MEAAAGVEPASRGFADHSGTRCQQRPTQPTELEQLVTGSPAPFVLALFGRAPVCLGQVWGKSPGEDHDPEPNEVNTEDEVEAEHTLEPLLYQRRQERAETEEEQR